MRVVRFYVSCPAFSSFSFSAGPRLQALNCSVPRWTQTASSGAGRSLPDPNCKRYIAVFPPDPKGLLRIRVFPAGLQLQALDRSVPRRTRTANSETERSAPDLHSKLRIRVFPAGPPPRAQDRSVSRRTSTTKNLRLYTR